LAVSACLPDSSKKMADFAEPLARLINEFKRLPGIGQKSAQRIAFHIMRSSRDDAEHLARTIMDVKDKLRICTVCNNISDAELCQYCRNPERDQTVVCVVEDPNNIVGVEVTRQFNGLYHVLGGALSPLRGIGPEQLRIKSLVDRIAKGSLKEIIVATNPTVEGEATAVYLSKLLKPLGMKVTRIAMGVPVGSDLEFADEVTMWKAMEGRREI
jgi:recombination protein RecR